MTGRDAPAAGAPVCMAMHPRKNRAKIIEINQEETGLTNAVTEVFLQGRAEDILPELE